MYSKDQHMQKAFGFMVIEGNQPEFKRQKAKSNALAFCSGGYKLWPTRNHFHGNSTWNFRKNCASVNDLSRSAYKKRTWPMRKPWNVLIGQRHACRNARAASSALRGV